MKERHLSVELERFSIAEHLKVNMQHLCFTQPEDYYNKIIYLASCYQGLSDLYKYFLFLYIVSKNFTLGK